MKKLIPLMIFAVYLNSIEAQDIDLLENNWYLEKLLIENEEVLPPSSNCSEQGRVYFFDDVISVDNLCCDSSCGSAISYQDTSGFELFDGIGCLLKDPDCTSVELEYSELHTFVYFDPSNSIYFNPYSYEVSNNGDDLALVVTNGIGDKAYYNNVLLNTQNFQEPQLSIYPNPVNDKLFIESLMPIELVEIYDINGKEVLNKTTNTVSLDVSKLVAGVYFISITTGEGFLVKQFIKK